jgi:hypothetical protein
MFFEALYDSVMRRHRRDAGNTAEDEGQIIRTRLRELLGGDALKSGNELSPGGCCQCSAHEGVTAPPSAESPASTGGTGHSVQQLTVMSSE